MKLEETTYYELVSGFAMCILAFGLIIILLIVKTYH